MQEQNAKSHTRYIPLWHIIIPIFLLLILAGSIIGLVHADEHTHYNAVCILAIAILLPFFYWYTRWFALRAQDRAIRAEENLRHYILTGKPLDRELRMRQIIALRFASDEEFPSLAKRAVNEKLGSREIKAAIANWKKDFNRV